MTDGNAFMQIGEKFAKIEQRQHLLEQTVDALIQQLQGEAKNDGTESTKANR